MGRYNLPIYKYFSQIEIYKETLCALGITVIFFLLYAVLSLIKHEHFWTGYDLAVVDQATWLYSRFAEPISTFHAYAYTSILHDHVELIYAVISAFYWIKSDVRVLIVLHVLSICSSGYAVYLIAAKKKLLWSVRFAIVVSYLMFYGLQQAVWSDVHSVAFGVTFLAWFLYGLLAGKKRITIISFILAIISKEDIALSAFIISLLVFWQQKDPRVLGYAVLSGLYLFIVFGLYYPYFTPGYRFDSDRGILGSLDLGKFFDTVEKREVVWFSLVWFLFLPLGKPLYLIAAGADLFKYFVLGSAYVTSAQGMFGHYRFSLGLLLVWPLIEVISAYRKLNHHLVAVMLIGAACVLQYWLHLPLSYISKNWFWSKPSAVKDIRDVMTRLPAEASVATQVNIAPHLTHRQHIVILWPEKRIFDADSPCGQAECDWMRWHGDPQYVLADTSADWDIRHLLAQRDQFRNGIINVVKAGVLEPVYKKGEAGLYKVVKRPY